MATLLPCDNHSTELAVILMTNLDTGDTATFCAVCLLTWAQALMEAAEEEPGSEGPVSAPPEEVADLEPEPPAPDAGPKSEPAPEATPEPEPERREETAQEAEAAGD